MKILVIGSGGREHALVWKIAQSPQVKKIFAAPGNAGIASLAECVNIQTTDLSGLLNFAQKERIDLTVVGPEAPLVEGIADLFEKNGLLVFGPGQKGARLEGSKIFSKEKMRQFGIPTADFKIFDKAADALLFVRGCSLPCVIKADGLAAGKGVVIAKTENEAAEAVRRMMEEKIFGAAGDWIIIEECLKGEELSILAFTDGKKVIPLSSSQDHKRAFDQDQGPNTGGMGAYSPCPLVNDAELKRLADLTITPLIHGLAKEGIVYKGIIYAGLMLTAKGPFVLEYNCRLGDPETQVVLPNLGDDLVDILREVAQGNLQRERLNYHPGACLTVVMAAKGYPENYVKGIALDSLQQVKPGKDLVVFHAGTAFDKQGKIVSSGGRVLNVTAMAAELPLAYERAYAAVKQIGNEQLFYRTDIGKRAMPGKVILKN